uniref:Uncharacterized protein n=1 Tax=Desulfovibrio sp. U5L TaxID=596152 RepID=I2Q5J4_9BACT
MRRDCLSSQGKDGRNAWFGLPSDALDAAFPGSLAKDPSSLGAGPARLARGLSKTGRAHAGRVLCEKSGSAFFLHKTILYYNARRAVWQWPVFGRRAGPPVRETLAQAPRQSLGPRPLAGLPMARLAEAGQGLGGRSFLPRPSGRGARPESCGPASGNGAFATPFPAGRWPARRVRVCRRLAAFFAPSPFRGRLADRLRAFRVLAAACLPGIPYCIGSMTILSPLARGNFSRFVHCRGCSVVLVGWGRGNARGRVRWACFGT